MIWNRKPFAKIDQWVGIFSVSVVLKEVSHKLRWTVTAVHGPNNSRICHLFWEELDSIKRIWNGPWCLGGDWNVIRFPSERSSSNLNFAEMSEFFDWINQHSLVDRQLEGAQFAWSNHQEVPILSRIDRFFICGDWLELY